MKIFLTVVAVSALFVVGIMPDTSAQSLELPVPKTKKAPATAAEPKSRLVIQYEEHILALEKRLKAIGKNRKINPRVRARIRADIGDKIEKAKSFCGQMQKDYLVIRRLDEVRKTAVPEVIKRGDYTEKIAWLCAREKDSQSRFEELSKSINGYIDGAEKLDLLIEQAQDALSRRDGKLENRHEGRWVERDRQSRGARWRSLEMAANNRNEEVKLLEKALPLSLAERYFFVAKLNKAQIKEIAPVVERIEAAIGTKNQASLDKEVARFFTLATGNGYAQAPLLESLTNQALRQQMRMRLLWAGDCFVSYDGKQTILHVDRGVWNAPNATFNLGDGLLCLRYQNHHYGANFQGLAEVSVNKLRSRDENPKLRVWLKDQPCLEFGQAIKKK